MHIIFSHGRTGRPDSPKITALSKVADDFNYTYESIDYTDTQDPEIRAARLTETVRDQRRPFCLVGSSMGGYASLIASESADPSLLCGVFLLAPALYLPRYQRQDFTTELENLAIVHGWDDDVVLFEHSIRYAKAAHCTLHLVDDDHQFSRNPQLAGEIFTNFLSRLDDRDKSVDLWW